MDNLLVTRKLRFCFQELQADLLADCVNEKPSNYQLNSNKNVMVYNFWCFIAYALVSLIIIVN